MAAGAGVAHPLPKTSHPPRIVPARGPREAPPRPQPHHRLVPPLRHASHPPSFPFAQLQPAQVPSHPLRPSLQLPLLARLGFHHSSPKLHRRLPARRQLPPQPPALKPRQDKPIMLHLPVRQIPRGLEILMPIRGPSCLHSETVLMNSSCSQEQSHCFVPVEEQASETISDSQQHEPQSHHRDFPSHFPQEAFTINHLKSPPRLPPTQQLPPQPPKLPLPNHPKIATPPDDRIKLFASENATPPKNFTPGHTCGHLDEL